MKLTGKTRVRTTWCGQVVLQVEERRQVYYRGRVPPRLGHPDNGPTELVWRDAIQRDLSHFEPPFVIETPIGSKSQ